MPTVSVIIPVFNGEKYIEQALSCVYSQTYRDFEVICVDDGSTDRSSQIINEFNKNVTYYYQKNRGISAARNIGIKLSCGDLIAFLDQDDIWCPDKLRLQVDYMSEHLEVAMVHSNVSISRNDTIIYPELNIRKRHKGFSIFEELYLGNFINTLTVVVRREVFDVCGLFDEEFKIAQDYDLWLRIAAEFKIGYQDVVMGIYRLHENNTSKGDIELIKDELSILDKMKALYPALVASIPQERVRERYFGKNYSLGYGYFCQYDMSEARKYFLRALQCKRASVRPYVYILSSYLGRRAIDMIRLIKRKATFLQQS